MKICLTFWALFHGFFEHWFGEDGGGLKVEWDVKNDAEVKRGVSWKRELKQKKMGRRGDSELVCCYSTQAPGGPGRPGDLSESFWRAFLR